MRRRFLVVAAAVAVLLTGQLFLRDAGVSAAQQAQRGADSRLAALRQERVEIARRALELLERQFRNDMPDADAELGQWQRRLFEAETAAAAADKAGRVAAAERYVEAMRKRVERAQRQSDAAVVGASAVLAAKYDLAGAECALEELKAQ